MNSLQDLGAFLQHLFSQLPQLQQDSSLSGQGQFVNPDQTQVSMHPNDPTQQSMASINNYMGMYQPSVQQHNPLMHGLMEKYTQ